MTEESPYYNYIFFRGYNPNGFSSSNSVYSKFKITDNYRGNAYIRIGGNIMSLLYKDSFWKEDISPNNTIPNNYCFYNLFSGSNIYSCLGGPGSWVDDQQKLHPLNPLRLPATILSNYCYSSMFANCSLLKYGPLILGGYVLILIFKIPQRIAKLCGKKIFESESDDSMNEIKEGHDYYMEINKKYDGGVLPKEKLILPKDKYDR